MVDTPLFQLVSFALHPAVIGLTVLFSPDGANPALFFLSSQRAKTIPFAGHFLSRLRMNVSLFPYEAHLEQLSEPLKHVASYLEDGDFQVNVDFYELP